MRGPAGRTGASLEECNEAELIQLAIRRFSERVSGEALLHSQGYISDGSVLHEWVYTTLRLALGRLPEPSETLSGRGEPTEYDEVAKQLGLLAGSHAREAYDVVIHVPADVPLPLEHRPISEHFRTLSDELTLSTLKGLGITAHTVRGTTEERLRHAHAVITSDRRS
jgi:hypothetical protein